MYPFTELIICQSARRAAYCEPCRLGTQANGFSTGILRCQMMTPSQFVCTMGPVVQHMIPVIRRKVNIV